MSVLKSAIFYAHWTHFSSVGGDAIMKEITNKVHRNWWRYMIIYRHKTARGWTHLKWNAHIKNIVTVLGWADV